jgi:hypothetical protein
MNRALVDRIANAVLYEGYILYPYRPSVKNRHRWTFGGLLPESFCRGQTGVDHWYSQTECLVHGDRRASIEIAVRFLHLTDRVVGEIEAPLTAWRRESEPPIRPVESLRVGDRVFYSWQEAEERSIHNTCARLESLLDETFRRTFEFPGYRTCEPISAADGRIAGALVRRQHGIQGVIECSAEMAGEHLFRIRIRVLNQTPCDRGTNLNREQATLRSLASAHGILQVAGGEFVSLLDPPDAWRDAAAHCRNVGVWPVLVGDDGETDCMLSAPIILYDYPQVAAESPGDLFDSTEIDEILTLRILTLTEQEKTAAASVDERIRALLARTSMLSPEDIARLHGAIRSHQMKRGVIA